MTENQKLIILGVGELAKVVTELIDEMQVYQVESYVIDQPPYERRTKFLGKPIYWIDDLDDMSIGVQALCTIFQIRKEKIIDKVKKRGIPFINLIHPTSYIAPSVQMGKGNIITTGVNIATQTQIGNHNIINRGALIGHDVIINDYSTIAPGVNIASSVKVGRGAYLGMGAIIPQNIKIGEGAFIGAGSLVTRDVPDRVKVVGMPARIIEREIGESFL